MGVMRGGARDFLLAPACICEHAEISAELMGHPQFTSLFVIHSPQGNTPHCAYLLLCSALAKQPPLSLGVQERTRGGNALTSGQEWLRKKIWTRICANAHDFSEVSRYVIP